MKKAAVTFATLFLFAALATANAKTYHLTLFQPTVVAGTELKAGEYGIDIKDSSFVIRNGKTAITVPARLETVDNKYPASTVRYRVSNGRNQLDEIRLGGTRLKLVVGAGGSDGAAAAGQTIH